jgi:hypothetical protein
MLIPLSKLITTYNMKIKGIIHVGAHECEELLVYNQGGVPTSNIVWIEGQEHLCKKMRTVNPSIYWVHG